MPNVWIQGEPVAMGGHYSVLSRMARAFTDRGWRVFLLTNTNVANAIRQHEGFDLHNVRLIELPPTLMHEKKQWKELTDEEKANAYIADLQRLKVALEAYYNPDTRPDAIITERWPIAAGICTQVLAGTRRREIGGADPRNSAPLSDTQRQEAATLLADIEQMTAPYLDQKERLPGLLKAALADKDTHPVVIASAVRDITGNVRHRDKMLKMLMQHCDRVFVLGGSKSLSDFATYFTGTGRFSNSDVSYLGRFFHDDKKFPPMEASGAPPILVQVGFSMNNKDHWVPEKMTIFKATILAWSKSESLRTHPLHLLLPYDTSEPQRAELQSIISGLGNDADKVQLRQAVKPAEFQALLQQAHMLVTAGGGGTCQEALMLHVPMVIAPLSQESSHEQSRRAMLFQQHRLAESIPLHSLRTILSEQGIKEMSAAMERASNQDRRILERRIKEHPMKGMNDMVTEVEHALVNFEEVKKHRKQKAQRVPGR